VVAMKTLYYYLKHSIFPIRMGLYHEWGFHYEKSLERRDLMFWKGFACFVGLILLALNSPYPVQLGILWFFIFSTGFWNWITAQQFVTERYIMVSTLGLGIVIASFTQDHLWAYSFILGCYLCRTWNHLPTSDYDVPHVNIFYQFRTSAMLLINNGDYEGGIRKMREAVPFLEKALMAKVCHFPEQWRKEHQEILSIVSNPSLLLEQELLRLINQDKNLTGMLVSSSPERTVEIRSSIEDNRQQIQRLLSFFKSRNLNVNNPGIFNHFNSEQMLSNLTRR
jgi:hypothetical protein